MVSDCLASKLKLDKSRDSDELSRSGLNLHPSTIEADKENRPMNSYRKPPRQARPALVEKASVMSNSSRSQSRSKSRESERSLSKYLGIGNSEGKQQFVTNTV